MLLDPNNIEVSGPRTGLGIAAPARGRGPRRGWRPVAIEVSAVPDVLYPYDPDVVRAIRDEFDPGIIPLIVRRVFKAQTGELRVARFHAIATHREVNTDTGEAEVEPPDPWTFRVVLPLLYEGPHGDDYLRPNRMAMHLEDRTTRLGDGLPGSYIPFDWRVYNLFRVQYQLMTAAQKQALNQAAEESRRKAPAADDHTRQSWKENPQMVERMRRITRKDEEIAAEKIARDQRPPMVGWRRA